MEVQLIKGHKDDCSNKKVNTDKLIRVAAYIRVSTDHEDQLSSLDNQRKYYERKINKNESWELVNIYSDEGISGTRDIARPGFIKMIKDACNEKIDSMSFDKKHNLLQNKIEDISNKIKTIDEKVIHEDNINLGIENIKQEIQARETDKSPKLFDEELFDTVVDYGIIGGVTENGTKEPYMIRFICKTGLASKSRSDITDETIIDNNQLGKEDSIYMPIIDFISNQHFFVYNVKWPGLKKQLITKVRVRVEVEK